MKQEEREEIIKGCKNFWVDCPVCGKAAGQACGSWEGVPVFCVSRGEKV